MRCEAAQDLAYVVLSFNHLQEPFHWQHL